MQFRRNRDFSTEDDKKMWPKRNLKLLREHPSKNSHMGNKNSVDNRVNVGEECSEHKKCSVAGFPFFQNILTQKFPSCFVFSLSLRFPICPRRVVMVHLFLHTDYQT